MKKFIVLFIAILVMFSSCSIEPSARQKADTASRSTAEVAISTIPVPQLSYFQERRTAKKWAEYWDIPNVITYVYVVANNGSIVGYFVSDGKPASTRSYLTPEEQFYSYGNSTIVSAPDIDGTYGDNNPGIRFFTAEGVPVEVGGNLGYIYSPAPLPLNVPVLTPVKK